MNLLDHFVVIETQQHCFALHEKLFMNIRTLEFAI